MAYFSNGSEGSVLEDQCSECVAKLEGQYCPIHSVQVLFNYKQNDNPNLTEAMNVLIDENGVCQMKRHVDRICDAYRDMPGQMKMFK